MCHCIMDVRLRITLTIAIAIAIAIAVILGRITPKLRLEAILIVLYPTQ
jgi:hypothetical protein